METTKHGNSMPDNKSALSSGDQAAYLSNASFAYLHALHLACQHVLMLGPTLNTPATLNTRKAWRQQAKDDRCTATGRQREWPGIGIQPYQTSFASAIPPTWCHSPCGHGIKEAPKALDFSHCFTCMHAQASLQLDRAQHHWYQLAVTPLLSSLH